MSAVLIGLWVFGLLLSLGSRRHASVLVVVVPVVLVASPDEGQPATGGEAWLRRQLEGLGTEPAP